MDWSGVSRASKQEYGAEMIDAILHSRIAGRKEIRDALEMVYRWKV